MLTPEWLAGCAEPLRALYLEAAADVLDEMAKRIAAYDFYIPAAQYQEEKLKQMGLTRQTVQKELKKRTAKTEEELRRLMKEGAALALSRGYAGEGRARPQTMSEPMKKLLEAAYRQTAGLLENITKTTANTASRQLEHALDLAWMEVSSGAMSPQEASRKAIKRLASQGLSAVTYPSGKTDSLTTAVTRAVRTGVNQGALQIALQDAKELGCDLVEVTAHAGARPDHALWQGKVYSISGKTEGYPKLSTATGYGTGAGLGGWNCRHSFFPYAEGSSKSYTDEELQRLEDEVFMTYRGKTLTRGEADAMKQNIRSAKEKWTLETSMLHAAKLDAAQAKSKLRKWTKTQAEFENVYHLNVANSVESDILNLEDIVIFRSLGAKSRNYDINDPITGNIYHLAEGTKIQNVQVFAGYKVKKPLYQETLEGLMNQFPESSDKWQHCKGIGWIDDNGERIKAEIHWFQEENVGRMKFKIKRWLDDES